MIPLSTSQLLTCRFIGQTARAPLGNKTTNAKTKVFQTPAGPAAEKDSSKKAKPSSARPSRAKIQHPQSVKLEIHGDNEGPLEERDIEYMPPKPKDLPYISEDFPDGCLNYDMLKGGNLTKGWQEYYFNPVDENGISLAQKREDEADAKAAKETDDRILREMEELDWSVGDCPGLPSVVKKTIEQPKPKPAAPAQAKTTLPGRAPSTINSRNAASVLSTAPKATAAHPALSAVSAGASKPKSRFPFLSGGKKAQPAPASSSNTRFAVAAAASRSTMGYNKGRSASSVVHEKSKPPPRSTTALSFTSTASDKPQASGAHSEHKATNFDEEDMKRLRFLSAFDGDEEELETGLKDGLPDCLRNSDDDEDEFVLTLGN